MVAGSSNWPDDGLVATDVGTAPESAVIQIDKKRRRRQIALDIRRDRYLYMLLVVPVAYYLIFKYAPMYGVTIAFKDYNLFKGVFASEWVGFEVFRQIFNMPDFMRALRNTLLLNMLGLLIGFPAPIIIAVMLSELRSPWFKRTAQTVLYLPHFISWMIIGGMVYQIFATRSGTINGMLTNWFGIEPIPFLTQNFSWVAIYIFSGIWQSMGWGAIIYLAAIAGINPELYEAATVDGCTRLQRIRHITLPGIRPTVSILLILRLGRFMDIGFEPPYVLGNVLVREYSDVISTFVYRVGIQSAQFSVATAVGLFQSVIGLILLITANQMSKRIGDQGLW